MFLNIKLNGEEKIYIQIYRGIEEMIEGGMLPCGSKLPSTRELGHLLGVGRTTVVSAYELLEENDLVHTVKGRGTFVSEVRIKKRDIWNVDWLKDISSYASNSEKLDIMKHEVLFKRGMISFKSIAPDENLFDIEELKRSFLNLISLEGEKILNYGYAKGYKPLVELLMRYMANKGVDTTDKSIIVTNGFTEGFDLVLSTIMEKGDIIICENPTHNTAIKQMRLHGLNLVGVDMTPEGMDLDKLRMNLATKNAKAAYLVPSYHNPTGIVMPYEKRKEVYEILNEYNVPIIEDGFNEELQHLGAHIAPIAAVSGRGNSVVYIGSLSKILFPGMRIGWIFADNKLIDILESVKRSRNIHTSFLDQGILFHYMNSGSFERYIKKVRGIYRERFELTKSLAEKYIPNEFILGDGGLYLFLKLPGINSRELLKRCCTKGVIFTPGDIFYTNAAGDDTLRLGFSRVSQQDIEKGIKIIGEEAVQLLT